jgi:hypothetical protein
MTHVGRISFVITTVLLVFIGGFSPVPGHAADDPMVRAPWLRDHLPDDALAYLRIPHLYGLFAAPKGNVLDPALRSDANMRSIRSIRQGISDNVLPLIPAFDNPALRLLERHQQSPVEIAIVAGQAPSVVMSLHLDLRSNVELQEVFDEISASNSAIGLAAPLNENGIGQVMTAGMTAFIQFDDATGRLLVNAGPAVMAESFTVLLEAIVPNDDHAMHALEMRVDESGQGFFHWINAARAIPMMQLMMQPDQFAEFTAMGLDKVSAAAIGWGVANGKGRLSVAADLPGGSDRGLLPYISNDITARSVGNPDGLILFSLPTAAEFTRLESRMLEKAGADGQSDWLKAKASFRENLGIAIEDLFEAVGPELLVIFDEAGDYSAIRLRDAARWKRLVNNIAKEIDSKPEKKRVGSETYFHWRLSSVFGDTGNALADKTPWLAELLARQQEHVFWTEDGDYLYFASIPQILIDRAASRPKTDVGSWLAETQRIDAESAILSVSGTSQKLPRRLYATYVEILQLLADIGQADFDIWSMPTAAQLELPRTGTLGFTASLGDPTLSAEFTFENNPGEMLGGLGGVAMVGVLAAIAIPAYQDYTIRAKVSEGINLSGAKKAAIVEYYFENGRFPDMTAAMEMSTPEEAGKYTRAIIIEPDTGRILVDYREEEIPGGGQLYLRPESRGGYVEWSCSATIADKHLPAACRVNDAGE